MDTVMEEKRGTYTALSLSLALHVILLLAAGALGLFSIAVPQTAQSSPLGSSPPPATVRWIARRLRRGIAFSSTRGTMDAGAFGRSHFGSGWSRA